jgi:acetolactate synthase-1/2/3 large subunit
MPALRDLIVQRLRDIGVHTLFGMPGGGGNLDLIDAAGRAGLPFVLTATETGGALAAMAQAEVIGRPGACRTTLGPGAASVANGVACAFLDRAAAQHVSDVPAGVGELDAALSICDWDLDDVHARVDRQRQAVDVRADSMTAQQVVRIAAGRLPATRVTVDAGAHMFPVTMLWPVREPNQMLISNGLSTMGFALPAAIGAALADRDRPVVALTGDGGLLMCAAELLTAAREKLRVVVIVFSDASLSLIEIKQQRRRYQPTGVSLGTVNWRALAEGFGVTPFVAATEAELARSIDASIELNGPSLIEARIDRSNYATTLAAVRG